MNNFERHEAIEELLAKHTARELAGMVVDARKDLSIAEDLVLGDLSKIKAEAADEIERLSAKLGEANEELSSFFLAHQIEENKIKAEGVREALKFAYESKSIKSLFTLMKDYIEKLESINEASLQQKQNQNQLENKND